MTAQPKQKCATCNRTLPLPEHRECSHINCAHRKQPTALPPQRIQAGRVPARINDNH